MNNLQEIKNYFHNPKLYPYVKCKEEIKVSEILWERNKNYCIVCYSNKQWKTRRTN